MKIEETIFAEKQALDQNEGKIDQTLEIAKQTIDQNADQMEQTLEWLTVPEFAERAGCSRQAVYYRLGKDLAEYSKKENGKTVIDSRAANLIEGEKKQTVDQNGGQMEQAFALYLQGELERIREENADLKKAIAEKDEQILDLAKKFADLAENEQKVAALALAAEPPKLEAGQTLDQNDKQTEQTAEPERRGIFGWLRKK